MHSFFPKKKMDQKILMYHKFKYFIILADSFRCLL